MTLYDELTEALHGPERGDAMERVLKEAAAAGLKPGEALNVLERMYDEAVERDNESDQNLICDLGEIAQGYCLPECRIWSLEETNANNAKAKGFWG